MIIGGMPVNANKIIAAAIAAGEAEPYSPGIDFTLMQCPTCQTDMWIGPNQRATYEANPGIHELQCVICAMAQNAAMGIPTYVTNLGYDPPVRRTT